MKSWKWLTALFLLFGYAHAGTYLDPSLLSMNLSELEREATSCDEETCYLGDLIIPKHQIISFGSIGGPTWTGGRFVYQFQGQSAAQQDIFRAACAEWSTGTPLQCVERTTEERYVIIRTHFGNGCGPDSQYVSCSSVGMVAKPGLPQSIKIYSGHWDFGFGTIVHEIGHALGLIHEHSRSDRDNYVLINWANIKENAAFNFRTWAGSRNLTDYDYNSIMHYNNCAFASDSQCNRLDPGTEPYWTISPAPCGLDFVGGSSVSPLDLETITRVYGGAIASLYKSSRRASCGRLEYSKHQVEAVCGANCDAASQVTWDRVYTHYERTSCGGFIPILDPIRFCTGRGQDLIDQWWDRDQCIIGVRTERWTQCGCSKQLINASCANYDIDLDSEELTRLATSGTPLERLTADLITSLNGFDLNDWFDADASAMLPSIYIAAFVQAQSASPSHNGVEPSASPTDTAIYRTRIDGVVCELELLRALKVSLNTTSQMISSSELSSIVSKWDLALL